MKKLFDKKTLSGIMGVFSVVFFFVVASLVADKYDVQMQTFVQGGGMMGIFAYVFITIIAVVVAPISTLPLLPIASMAWGWFLAGLLSIIGWTIGSQIAFFLARHFGKPFLRRIVSLEKLEKFEKRIPEKNVFLTVVFLRMAVPVDILSYALGLFSRMGSVSYFFATLIGVTPFAFVFAYVGTLSFLYQMEMLGATFFVFMILWYSFKDEDV